MVPPVHSIALGNFQASFVIPGPHGLVLYGNPGATGKPIGPAGGYALYYYDFAAKRVETIATPTPASDGTVRGVLGASAAGDWVVYVIADGTTGHWQLWAWNAVTGVRTLIDSATKEHSQVQLGGDFAADGTDVVWSAAVEPNGFIEQALREYTLATGKTRTLISGANAPIMHPLAMANGALFFDEAQSPSNTTYGTYLWVLDQSKPVRVSDEPPANATMNDRYIVWDQPHTMTLTLYDRVTGKVTDDWVTSCIRPSIALDRPYLVCLDYDTSTFRLVEIPSGREVPFFPGQASGAGGGMVANGRDYWVATTATDEYSNHIDYIDLPAN